MDSDFAVKLGWFAAFAPKLCNARACEIMQAEKIKGIYRLQRDDVAQNILIMRAKVFATRKGRSSKRSQC